MERIWMGGLQYEFGPFEEESAMRGGMHAMQVGDPRSRLR